MAKCRVNIVETIRVCEQYERAAVEWHEANAHFQTDRERTAFKAGHAEGWSDAMKWLSLNGKIERV